MKILLISTNREKLPMPVAPIGVAYLAATLRANGYEVAVLDLCFEKHCHTAVSSYINRFRPDIIGLSLRNLDNSTAFGSKSYIVELKELVATIKAVSPAVMIIGGSGFSSSPQPLLEYLDLPYGVVGEGEAALLQFVQRIEQGLGVTDIPGLIYRVEDGFRRNAGGAYLNLDELPAPAWDLIDYRRYMRYGGYGAIQTKRGCCFNCIYCSYPVIEGRHYRLRSPRRIVDEIEQLHRQHGIDYFFFVDSVFSFPVSHAQSICEELIRRQLPIAWEAMTNPRGITEDLVRVMKQSGCIGIEVGIDSASPTMLKNLGKNFVQADIKRAVELYRRFAIPFSIYLLLGGPGETEATIRETVEFLDGISQPNQLLMNFGIRIYAATPLAEVALHSGLIADEDELLTPKVYRSDRLAEDIFPLLNEYCRSRLHWSNATDWNSPLSNMMMSLAQRLQLRPFWKHSKLLGMARRLHLTVIATKLNAWRSGVIEEQGVKRDYAKLES